MASPTATGLGDTPPVRVPAGHRPNRRDGAGQAARLKPRTQSGGGFGGGKGLREHDAQETVFFRRDDGQRAIVMAEDVRQVDGQFRPCLDLVVMIRERPESHDIPAATVPFERCTGRLRRSLVPGGDLVPYRGLASGGGAMRCRGCDYNRQRQLNAPSPCPLQRERGRSPQAPGEQRGRAA